MTLTFMRPAIAVAIALSLASCGGKASFPITGTVFNLQYPGLVLSTNGMTVAVNPPANTFKFPNTLSYGDTYDVVVVKDSQPLHQFCTVQTAPTVDQATGKVYTVGKDTAGRISTINIGVTCVLNTASIGGHIKGLTSAGLVLTNGSDPGTVAPLSTDVDFTFPNKVPYNVSYGVSVLAQPANDFCSVSPNGSGVMGDVAVGDILVTCVPKS